MSQDPDLPEPITVLADDVSVEKSFVADEFPVPAVKFVVRSTSSDSVDVRLTDDVPESVPMDCVGFHPDYENDRWTAYQDHRVEFVRTLAPEESVTTVYGIRLDETDADASAFLAEPTLDLVSTDESGGPEAEGVEDIVGEDTTGVVRDVLAGDSDTVPGMDEDVPDDLDFEDPLAGGDAAPVAEDDVDPLAADDDVAEPLALDDPLAEDDTEREERAAEEPLALDDPLAAESVENADGVDDPDDLDDLSAEMDESNDPSAVDTVDPRMVDADTVSAVVERASDSERTGDVDTETDTDPLVLDASEAEETGADDEPDAETAETSDASTTPGTPDPASAAAAATSTGIAATLATEIREGRVDDDDLAVLKRELDIGVPNSVDLRIGRLQSQMEDLAAYSDALEEFIDEEGTGEQLVADLRTEVDSVASSLSTLETALSSAESDRVDLRNEVDDVATTVTGVEKRVETNTQDLSTLADDVEELADVADDIEELAATVDSLDTEMGDVRADVADLDADLVESSAALRDELDTVREDVTAQVDDLQETLVDDVETLKREMDDIHAELAELKQFRDRLGSAFGGN
jgi:methyl-accepting chemotaxis protein